MTSRSRTAVQEKRSMTKQTRTVNVWAAVLATVAMTAALSAQGQTPVAAPAGQTQTPGAPGNMQKVDQYIVGQAKPPEVAGTTVKDLTLEDAVQIALEKNLDLKVQKMNPQLQDYQLQSARAVYRPTISFS